MLGSLRINILPLNENSFRLEDNLYFADCLYEEGRPRQSAHTSTPLKVEICFFLFCCRGNVSVRIDQEDYDLKENDLFLGVPGSILERIDFGETDEIILFAFDRESVPFDIRTSKMTGFLSKVYNYPSRVCSLSPGRMQHFRQLYVATRDMLLAEPDSSVQDNILQGFAYLVLGMLDGWEQESDSDFSKRISRPQRILMAFMSDVRHYAIEHREVSFYADRAALSTKYFSRLVVSQSGKRPLDHIRDYLILEAKCLLASGQYTVKQIADYLNFSNTSAFTRFFRTGAGTTPAEFIASLTV